MSLSAPDPAAQELLIFFLVPAHLALVRLREQERGREALPGHLAPLQARHELVLVL